MDARERRSLPWIIGIMVLAVVAAFVSAWFSAETHPYRDTSWQRYYWQGYHDGQRGMRERDENSQTAFELGKQAGLRMCGDAD